MQKRKRRIEKKVRTVDLQTRKGKEMKRKRIADQDWLNKL